jgi:hypothetical protein
MIILPKHIKFILKLLSKQISQQFLKDQGTILGDLKVKIASFESHSTHNEYQPLPKATSMTHMNPNSSPKKALEFQRNLANCVNAHHGYF